ncbi:MAG: FliG C-terminal domain-containing protein [Spirochaetota bacterium]
MFPAILQRKWIDYMYKDRFIPSVKYDNILPVELNYDFIQHAGKEFEIRIKSLDKNYKNTVFQILDTNNEIVFQKKIPSLSANKTHRLKPVINNPGEYTVIMVYQERRYDKSKILVIKQPPASVNSCYEIQSNQTDFPSSKKTSNSRMRFYCSHCKSRTYPVKPSFISGYIYKNYIPFKDYIDLEGLSIDYITEFLKKIKNPRQYKSGLVHLFNIIRVSSLDDELKVMTSLFKDDPCFAYFITNKLFLFDMIPLMKNKELQIVLNKIDDSLISRSLRGKSSLLIQKVLHNISIRRARAVQEEMKMLFTSTECKSARKEMEKTIKTFFTERMGRVLKIPCTTKTVYVKKSVQDSQEKIDMEENFLHCGDIIITDGSNLYSYHIDIREHRCLDYDVETFCQSIFEITGVSESSIYLMSKIPIRYCFIHIYNWMNNLEDVETLESISTGTMVPIRLLSSGVILTVGAIDARKMPWEQVIRLKTK